MTIAAAFDYLRPTSLAGAIAALRRPGAVPLCGGTDLLPALRNGLCSPPLLVDIKSIPALHGIRLRAAALHIGACTTFADLIASPLIARHAPLLLEMATQVANAGIRNRATPLGNICSAVPCCDAGPALLVLDAAILCQTTRAKKRIPIARWFTGPRQTALPSHALATAIEIPLQPGLAAAFAKRKRIRGGDLALASVAAAVDPHGTWRIAYGSLAPRPARGTAAEHLLAAHPNPTDDTLAEAGEAAAVEVSPITDIRATAEYRRILTDVLLRRAVRTAARRLAKNGPPYGTPIAEEPLP